MRILLFKGKGLISRLIQWQTRGSYSHAAILFDDGVLIEAVEGRGVRKRGYDPAEGADEFEIVNLRLDRMPRLRDFAEKQVGKGYDYLAILRFIDRERMPENDKWFCSELAFAALKEAGVIALERIDESNVSPHLLSISPFLRGPLPHRETTT